MQLSMKCSVAVHYLLFIWEARGKVRVTSTLLAQSTGCNPVVIRNILSALKKAGLITVSRGQGGRRALPGPGADHPASNLYRPGTKGTFLPDRHSSL